MTTAFRACTQGLTAAALLGMSIGAFAQGSLSSDIKASSAKSGSSFIGVEVGKPTYSTSCGDLAGLSCSNNGTSYSVTAGNMFTQNIGASLTYLDLGKADRAGGSVNAKGLNLSVLGELPLGDSVSLEGKVGGTYGITHVNVPAESGLVSGRATGFGLGYGVGLDVHVARGLRGHVGWESHDFHFVGQGTSNVKNITVGLGYQF